MLAVPVRVFEKTGERPKPLFAVGAQLQWDLLAGARMDAREGVERSARCRNVMFRDPPNDGAGAVDDLPLRGLMAQSIGAGREESELQLNGRASRFEKRPATL